MLVQRRIQEEIHGNKTIPNEIPPPSNPKPMKKSSSDERKTPSGRRSQPKEIFVNEQRKKSPSINLSNDRASPLTDDGEMSTNEIVARNQPSRLDFHKTLTPMIGKENFELRKKLFEHSDDFSFTGEILFCFRILDHSRLSDVPPCQLNDAPNPSKPSSRQSIRYLTYHNIPWKLKIRKEV